MLDVDLTPLAMCATNLHLNYVNMVSLIKFKESSLFEFGTRKPSSLLNINADKIIVPQSI